MSMIKKADIVYEEGVYIFSWRDEHGFVVTDGETIEELYQNIKEAMDLHYESQPYTLNLKLPIRLSLTNTHYATEL